MRERVRRYKEVRVGGVSVTMIGVSYIYLVQPHDLLGKHVYQIGRMYHIAASAEDTVYRQLPARAVLIGMWKVGHAADRRIYQNVLRVFRKAFMAHSRGENYFYGNVQRMVHRLTQIIERSERIYAQHIAAFWNKYHAAMEEDVAEEEKSLPAEEIVVVEDDQNIFG